VLLVMSRVLGGYYIYKEDRRSKEDHISSNGTLRNTEYSSNLGIAKSWLCMLNFPQILFTIQVAD
jgi:hypothetical protein